MDQTVKELKQLVEGGVREDARDWPCKLREYFMKHAYYKMIDSTALINGKGIILEGCCRLSTGATKASRA